MHWKYGVDYLVLAIENHDKINYTMPVRILLYDSLAYVEQIEHIWKEHMDSGEKVTSAEFLSKFKKGDKLKPVITIVFYYGDKPWDGAIDLYGMIGIDESAMDINTVKQVLPKPNDGETDEDTSEKPNKPNIPQKPTISFEKICIAIISVFPFVKIIASNP